MQGAFGNLVVNEESKVELGGICGDQPRGSLWSWKP